MTKRYRCGKTTKRPATDPSAGQLREQAVLGGVVEASFEVGIGAQPVLLLRIQTAEPAHVIADGLCVRSDRAKAETFGRGTSSAGTMARCPTVAAELG